MPSAPRLVVALVPDLFFATRIAATAKSAGIALELVRAEKLADRLAGGDVSLVVLDLHAPAALERLAEAKRVAPGTPVVGFHSHVETALRRDALAAGADAVLPRSAFTARLAAILTRGLDALASGPAEPRGAGAGA